jgi:hypothetical protein
MHFYAELADLFHAKSTYFCHKVQALLPVYTSYIPYETENKK